VATAVRQDDVSFLAELRQFLTEHPPPPDDGAFGTGLAWQRTLHEGGWVAPQWPVEFGGRDASLRQLALYLVEMGSIAAPQVANRIGINNIAPSLLQWGTPQQRARYAPPMLSGDEIWCQLFSEPEAGSDLGGLRTKATLAGDHWIVTGEKVWTSHGQHAHLGFALVRTEDPLEHPRQRGLTCMVIDLAAPGVVVQPLRDMTGNEDFSRVTLHEVAVPVADTIGTRGDGWRVAQTSLISERGVAYPFKEQTVLARILNSALARCRAGPPVNAVTRHRLVDDYIHFEVFRFLNLGTLEGIDRGLDPGPRSSLVKLAMTNLAQHLTLTVSDLDGMSGIAGQPSTWLPLLWYRMGTIAGGTSEIQRNILAERMLGLPRQPAIGSPAN
jgi:alkylation response protein AidB-like acyl-CoA dehydrogenase